MNSEETVLVTIYWTQDGEHALVFGEFPDGRVETKWLTRRQAVRLIDTCSEDEGCTDIV